MRRTFVNKSVLITFVVIAVGVFLVDYVVQIFLMRGGLSLGFPVPFFRNSGPLPPLELPPYGNMDYSFSSEFFLWGLVVDLSIYYLLTLVGVALVKRRRRSGHLPLRS